MLHKFLMNLAAAALGLASQSGNILLLAGQKVETRPPVETCAKIPSGELT